MSLLSKGTRSIDYIASLVMADLDEMTTKNYQKYLQLGINCCLYELKLSSSPTIKTVHLTVADNGTIDFPHDYINYLVIGVCLNGRVWTLTRNDSICLNREEDCPVELSEAIALSETSTDDQIEALVGCGYYFNGSFRNGQYVGEQYAYGGGWNGKGYYRVDEQMRRIEFSRVSPGTEIILEYNATGIDCDGAVVVPFECVASIKAYVHWQRIEYNDNYSSSDKERKRREYIVQFQALKHYKLMFTASEFLDAKYRSIKMTPKR